MSAAFNKIKKVDRSKLEGNALKAYDSLKEETDNFDKDVAVALNLDDDVERLAKKLEEKFPESVGKKKEIRIYKPEQAKKRQKKAAAKKKAAKKKSTPKGGSGNKGSFAKLRASIAKREGISYKAALPIAKKEYAEQKKKDSDSKKEKRAKRMEAFKRKYKGRGTRNTDVQKDAKIPAKAVGKRVSKTGNTYYEYRDNRTDQRQPQPTNEPRLDVGGVIKREYDVRSPLGTYSAGGEITQAGDTDYPNQLLNYAKGGKIGDEGMFEGGEITIIKKNPKSYVIAYLKDDGTPYNRKFTISKDKFESQFSKFAKGGKTDGDWIQGAVEEMKEKGTIGSFTKKAEKRGMTPVEFASEVLDSTNKNKFTEKTRKQAQFVKNANPELFAFGGEITRDYDVRSPLGTYARGGKFPSLRLSDFDEDIIENTYNELVNNIDKTIARNMSKHSYYKNLTSEEFDRQIKRLRADFGELIKEITYYAEGGDIKQECGLTKDQVERFIKGLNSNISHANQSIKAEKSDKERVAGLRYEIMAYESVISSLKFLSQKNMAQGGDILKAGDTDCPDELLNYAVGGELNDTMQGLKKGDTIKIKFGSAFGKDNNVTLKVRSRNKVRKGTIDKITFENVNNPKGVKFFAYDRGSGFSFAMGDLGIYSVELLDKYNKGGYIDYAPSHLPPLVRYRVKRVFKDGSESIFDENVSLQEAEKIKEEYNPNQTYYDIVIEKMAKGGKTQGYNAQLDESLGDRTGREDLFEQKKKDRRDESKAMEKAMGRRAYASVRQMDKKKRRR